MTEYLRASISIQLCAGEDLARRPTHTQGIISTRMTCFCAAGVW
jgi:hypothetical protein